MSIPEPCRRPVFANKSTCRTARHGAQCLGLQEGREADRASSMLEPPLGGGSGERHVQRMPGPVRRGLLLCPHSNALLSRAVRESRFRCAQVDDLPTLFLEKEVAVRSVRSGSGGRFCANGRGPGLALGSGQQPPSKQLWHRLLTFRSPPPCRPRRPQAVGPSSGDSSPPDCCRPDSAPLREGGTGMDDARSASQPSRKPILQHCGAPFDGRVFSDLRAPARCA